jgi:hypothetical protein
MAETEILNVNNENASNEEYLPENIGNHGNENAVEDNSSEEDPKNLSGSNLPNFPITNFGAPLGNLPKKSPKKREGSRKGKWTPEEEKFANKIIEVFNAGLLKLEENEKGTTLRAYLAAKLDCDPMRITKKYTGASCLGKRVYHFDPKGLSIQEAETARRELEILERQYRSKLDNLHRKKSSDGSNSVENNTIISTPAIDALVQNAKPGPPIPNQRMPQNAYQMPMYPPNAFPPGQGIPRPFYPFPLGFYPFPGPPEANAMPPSDPRLDPRYLQGNPEMASFPPMFPPMYPPYYMPMAPQFNPYGRPEFSPPFGMNPMALGGAMHPMNGNLDLAKNVSDDQSKRTPISEQKRKRSFDETKIESPNEIMKKKKSEEENTLLHFQPQE